MKKFSLVLALTALTFSAFACDDDSSNSNNNAGNFCDDVCAKEVECDTEDDLQACLTECGSMAPLMLDSFIDSMDSCIESHTCEEMPNCAELAASGCNTGTEDLAAAVCEKQYECEGETPTVDQINECVEAMQSGGDFTMMACYRPAPLTAYTDCIRDVECANAQTEMDACAEDHLGMVSDN